jgi:hypothetical protein
MWQLSGNCTLHAILKIDLLWPKLSKTYALMLIFWATAPKNWADGASFQCSVFSVQWGEGSAGPRFY